MRRASGLTRAQVAERYPYAVDVVTDLEKSRDIDDWLSGSTLGGSYVQSFRLDSGFGDGESHARILTYAFSNANAAFAFKMRWA